MDYEEYKRSAPLCSTHAVPGGARAGCLVCIIIRFSRALSEIDYLCGTPNEMRVSSYDIHCDEQTVIEHVRKKLENSEPEALRTSFLKEREGFVEQHRIHEDHISRLKMALTQLLPVNQEGVCIGCKRGEPMIHKDGFDSRHYDADFNEWSVCATPYHPLLATIYPSEPFPDSSSP